MSVFPQSEHGHHTTSSALLPGGRSPNARPRAAAAGLGKGCTGPAAAHESQRQPQMSCERRVPGGLCLHPMSHAAVPAAGCPRCRPRSPPHRALPGPARGLGAAALGVDFPLTARVCGTLRLKEAFLEGNSKGPGKRDPYYIHSK